MTERPEADRKLPMTTSSTNSIRAWRTALLIVGCLFAGCILLFLAHATFGLAVFALQPIFMVVAALVAQHHGRDPWLWALAGLLLGPVAIVLPFALTRAAVQPQPISRRQAVGLAGVVLVAVLVGVVTHHMLFRPPVGNLAQTSVSPDGRWELRGYFESSLGVGPDSGEMRAEIRQLVPHASQPRNIYLTSAPGENDLGIAWRKDDVLVITNEFGDKTILDPRTAPAVSVPVGFLPSIVAWFWTILLGILVLAGGYLGVFVVWRGRLPRALPPTVEEHEAPAP